MLLIKGWMNGPRYFLEQIAWLYNQERKYWMQNLSPEEIRQARNSDETNRVIA